MPYLIQKNFKNWEYWDWNENIETFYKCTSWLRVSEVYYRLPSDDTLLDDS